MSSAFRRPFEVVDHAALMAAHSPAPEYFEGDWLLEPDDIERRQLVRLQARAHQAYRVPFFRKRWQEAGFHPDQILTLGDLVHAPRYQVDDLRQSIESHPPLGDYQGGQPRRRRERAGPSLYVRRDHRCGAAHPLYAVGSGGGAPS